MGFMKVVLENRVTFSHHHIKLRKNLVTRYENFVVLHFLGQKISHSLTIQSLLSDFYNLLSGAISEKQKNKFREKFKNIDLKQKMPHLFILWG